jgi:hypothetical protein
MSTITFSSPTQLIDTTPEDQVLLSCHLLSKSTAAQLFRLHSDHITTDRQLRGMMRRFSTGQDRMLNVIKPIDIAQPIRSLPYVYLDTRASRRHLEQRFGMTYRRVPPVPSRDWRFLRHDVHLVDELISFELTARQHAQPFGYEPHFDPEGQKLYPEITIGWNDLQHTLRPQPDKTLIVGDHHLIIEHDCGEETIECGNIIRDATIGRKHLVYDQLFRQGVFRQLGWGRTIIVYLIDSKRGTQNASRKRVKRCLESIPGEVDPTRIFFTDRQSFLGAGDDVSGHVFMRGDGRVTPLPCW